MLAVACTPSCCVGDGTCLPGACLSSAADFTHCVLLLCEILKCLVATADRYVVPHKMITCHYFQLILLLERFYQSWRWEDQLGAAHGYSSVTVLVAAKNIMKVMRSQIWPCWIQGNFLLWRCSLPFKPFHMYVFGITTVPPYFPYPLDPMPGSSYQGFTRITFIRGSYHNRPWSHRSQKHSSTRPSSGSPRWRLEGPSLRMRHWTVSLTTLWFEREWMEELRCSRDTGYLPEVFLWQNAEAQKITH